MSYELRYVLTDPTGNRTVLCETPVPVDAQPAVAARLMAAEPTAEQVGFVTDDETCDLALRMAGGEFCANASMSAAALFAMRSGRTEATVTLRVSGAADPVTVEIAAKPDGAWQGTVQTPRPVRIEDVRFADGQTCPVVFFEGIAHVIETRTIPQGDAETLAKRRCAELSADALGLMFWDRDDELLTPLVYVPKADTLFWENSCGSGTAAVGAFLAKETGRRTAASLRQPGGVLGIDASPDGTLRLKGTVRCLYEKSLTV